MSPFRRQDSGAGTEKRVEHDVPAPSRIPDGIGHHSDGLACRTVVKSGLPTFARDAVGTRIGPHIGAVAPEPGELDIVAMARFQLEMKPILQR